MDSIKRHRYVTALVIAGTIFAIGVIVVLNRAGISEVGNANGLDINGVLQASNNAEPIPGAPPPVRPAGVNVPYTDIHAPAKNTPAQNPQPTSDNSFNWSSFVASLSHPPKQNTGTQSTSTSEAYSFFPSGLISPALQEPLTSMTASQKALYGWGEDAGGVILGYEQEHQNQPQILTDHMQDRQNPAKIAAVKKLGTDLQAVGDAIDGVGDIPPQMSTAGPALANAYREIGRNLAAIPDAKGDDATVKAILLYNKSAEAFVKKYVQVVLIFQANDVKFTQSEPGGVFMFPSSP